MRAQLLKKWSLYKQGEYEMEREVIGCLRPSRKHCRSCNLHPRELHVDAIEWDSSLFPFERERPDHMPPEGQYHNIIKVYTPEEFKRELQEAVLRTHCS